MSKPPRRWVTVENSRSLSDSSEKRKPSVFERLGSAPGRSSSGENWSTPQCKQWATTGACNYGSTCRFRHGPRRTEREKSPSDLRRRVPRKHDKKGESESESDTDKESVRKKKEKESKVKSAIVVQQSRSKDSDDSDSEEWENRAEDDDNDVDETIRLERKRQQLQRELSRLEAEDADSDRPLGVVDKPSSSQEETSDTAPPTPPHRSSHSREKYIQAKKAKHVQPATEDLQSKKKVYEKKKVPKVVKKKSNMSEESSDDDSFFKEKEKQKKRHNVPEKKEKIRYEDKPVKVAPKPKKKPQVERKRTRTVSTSSTSSSSSSSSTQSSSSPSSSSEDDAYRSPAKKKVLKTQEQRRRKSSEKRVKQTDDIRLPPPDTGRREKERIKMNKSPVKTKGRKGQPPSASYDERKRRESPDDRIRLSKKSISPNDERNRKTNTTKRKRSLSPKEVKRKTGVSPVPKSKSPRRTQSLERDGRDRSQETVSRNRRKEEEGRTRPSPSEGRRSSSRHDNQSDTSRSSRRAPSPEDRRGRDRRDESTGKRGESPEINRRGKQRSLDRQQAGRRQGLQESHYKNLPTLEQRGRQGRDNRETRESRGMDRKAVTPDSSNDKNRRSSPVRGRRGISQEDDSRGRRQSPNVKTKSKLEDSGRRQLSQDRSGNNDKHRTMSPAGTGSRDRAWSPQRNYDRSEGTRDKGRRPPSPDQDRVKSRPGGSTDKTRKGRSTPVTEDNKGRRGKSPQRQQEYDRNRGQQDNRDSMYEDSIQSRILNMAGYQDDRRGGDRRGERSGRDMDRQIDHRKMGQDDRPDRNMRDREQGKGRQPLHDDYPEQGFRDRRDRSRHDDGHDQRRGRDQQWDDRRTDDRFLDDRRGDDRRPEVMRDRHGREIESLNRPYNRKRILDEERGRSPPNKQPRREGSPTDSHISSSSRGRRDDRSEWEQSKQSSRLRDKGEAERDVDRRGREAREVRDNRDVSQKRGRSASSDNRQYKRHRAQQEDKRATTAASDDRTRRHESQAGGQTGEEFSDWSENDTDAELLNQPHEDRHSKNDGGSNDTSSKERLRERGRDKEKEREDRNRRSHSLTSIGSRHSYREDKNHDRKPSRDDPTDRNSTRGGRYDRGRDQKWKREDRDKSLDRRSDKSDQRDVKRERDKRNSEQLDLKDPEEERPTWDRREGDGQKEPEKDKSRAASVSSNQSSLRDVDGETGTDTTQEKRDGSPAPSRGQNEEALSEAELENNKLDMEYDEISDDDLDELIENADADEEQEVSKPGIVDSLDIDWASLCSMSKPKPPAATSALKRFTGANVLARIGLSKAYAGDELFAKIQKACQEQDTVEDKTGDVESCKLATKETKAPFEFLNDTAMLHCSAAAKLKMRMNIMSYIGPHRRALCARNDLAIRRHLCRIAKNTEGLTVYPNQVVDQDLYKQSIQMLRQDRNSTEDKKHTITPVTQVVV